MFILVVQSVLVSRFWRRNLISFFGEDIGADDIILCSALRPTGARPPPRLSEGLDPPLRRAPFLGGFHGLTGIRWMMS